MAVKPKVTNEPVFKHVSEELTCDLSHEEWRDRANQLSEAHRKTNQMKEDKKAVMASMNSDLKSAEAEETRLANVVATHKERRDVTVKVKYDYDLGLVTRVRTDTEEVIGERKMNDDERQSSLMDADDFIENAEL